MTGSQEILTVEDNPVEVELIGQALRAAGVEAFQVVQDLEHACEVLAQCQAARPDRTAAPSVVLLDLKLVVAPALSC